MSVVWTKASFSDLDLIYERIARDRPSIAEKILRTLLLQGERLGQFPSRGRLGRLAQTRELVIPALPYIIVYETRPSLTTIKPDVTVLRVIHSAMRWPRHKRA